VSCETLADKLTGYLDGELDPRDAGEVENHLRQCVACATRHERERRLRQAVRQHLEPLRAPEWLRNAVVAAVRAPATGEVAIDARGLAAAPPDAAAAGTAAARARRFSRWVPTWAATAAALVLGLAGGWQLAVSRGSRGEPSDLATEVIASHVRSLQATHLTDVGSSEHHTVKPWFAGKLDFSPPVPDLAARGFPLVGGRLDYLDGHQVAALVYRRRQHIINLFVWPAAESSAAPATVTHRGYQVVHGVAGGMAYWAVSDLNPAELTEFAQLTAQGLGTGP
jgi:anti-sigma factor (TIGR02949 family)